MKIMDSSGFYVDVTVSTPAGLIDDVGLCLCIGETLFASMRSKIRHSEGVLSPNNCSRKVYAPHFAVHGATGRCTWEWGHGPAGTAPAVPPQELSAAMAAVVILGFFCFAFCFLSQHDFLDSQL